MYNLGKTVFSNPKETPDVFKIEKKLQHANIKDLYKKFEAKSVEIKKVYNSFIENLDKKMEKLFVIVNILIINLFIRKVKINLKLTLKRSN